jgi:hypothetical protein
MKDTGRSFEGVYVAKVVPCTTWPQSRDNSNRNDNRLRDAPAAYTSAKNDCPNVLKQWKSVSVRHRQTGCQRRRRVRIVARACGHAHGQEGTESA